MPYNPTYYYPQNYYQPPVADQMNQFRQQPYQQPMQTPTQMQPIQQPQTQSGGILWVQGEEGAKAYMVAPGNSVLLMDSENSAFYIKSTDASGMPQPLRIFDYTERGAAQRAPASPLPDYVSRQEFDALKARIDALTQQKQPSRKTAPAKEEEQNA